MSLAAALMLLSSAAAGAPAPVAEPEPLRGPIKMKASQIREYNKGLAKDHPAFIRCESMPVTGSIAMRNKVCRTNKEWARIEDQGNAEARKLGEDLNKGWTSGTLGGG